MASFPQNPETSPDLSKLLYEAERFTLFHQSVIEAYPLQIYTAALVFSPKRSLIRNLFAHEQHKWVQRSPDVQDEWNAWISTLVGHSLSITEVVFSPTGKLMASGSRDGAIRLWHVETSRCVHILPGHRFSTLLLSFSSDEKTLVSVDVTKMLKVWDLMSSSRLAASVKPSTFSKGNIVVSPSCRHAAFLTTSGIEIQNLDGRNLAPRVAGEGLNPTSCAFTSDDDLATTTENGIAVYNLTLQSHHDGG
ncbi:hypothetical protein OQA88_3041 [Cercophora sp. LCS_1]